MSLLPPYQSSSAEAILWSDVPRGLEREATSLRDLKKRFQNIQILYKDKFVVIYGIKNNLGAELFGDSRIAYRCRRERKTFFGPPVIDDFNFSPGDILCGREGYDASCKNCGNVLYSHTDRNS